MFVIRPVANEDYEQIYTLSSLASVGLTTLPSDRDVLAGRIRNSKKSFADSPHKPGGESYLFVLEDQIREKIVGICGILSKVGGFEPNYTYKIHSVLKESNTLNVRKEIQYLKLRVDHNGPSEIGSLFLHPDYRGKNNAGRLLMLSRFLFMAEFAHGFENRVIAEMRGTIDEFGKTVFWESLGRHFFEVEYKIADLMVMKDKTFIADLMPKHPIYIPLLPEAAQRIIGKVHKNTRPAYRLLKQEGFEFNGEVDIFEAGPVLECGLSKIRTVKESVSCTLVEIHPHEHENQANFLIANVKDLAFFRSCIENVKSLSQTEISLSEKCVKALNLKIGDKVRYSPLK